MISGPLMTLAAILFVFLAVAISMLSFDYYRDILNPVSVFIPAWIVPYALYLLYPYPPSVQPRLSLVAHVVILGGGVAYLVGHILAAPTPSGLKYNPQRFKHSKLVVAVAVASMIYVSSIAFLLQFSNAGGLEALLSARGTYERNFLQGPILDDALNLAYIAAFIGVVYIYSRAKSAITLIPIILGFFFAALTLGRQRIIIVGGILLVAVNYYHYRVKVREIATVGAVGIGILIVMVTTFSWGLTGGPIGRAGVVVHPVITQLYWYIAMGMQNIEVLVSKVPLWHLGSPTQSLEFLWTSTGLESVVGLDSGVGASSRANRQFFGLFPTWSFVIPFYLDSGIAGVIIGSASIGYGVTRIYAKVRSNGHIAYMFAYALAVVALLLSFFNNLFTKPMLWRLLFQFGLLLIVMNLVERTIMKPIQRRTKMEPDAILKNSWMYTRYTNVANKMSTACGYSVVLNTVRRASIWPKLRAMWDNSTVVSSLRFD